MKVIRLIFALGKTPLPEGTALGIANALFSLTGMRQRSTPLNLG